MYVTRKEWTTDRPSVKLDLPTAGPYPIIGMEGYSYVVALPAHMKMPNVFYADRLRKHPSSPLPGQDELPDDPIETDGKPEYEVDQILTSCIYKDTLQYKANWVGYDPNNI